jgi:outer membrane protein assembly factor BamE (lipoprotein component of BamABCDE complex)
MIREEYHGKEFTNEVLNKLKIKKFTKEDVIDLLGNPSSSSIFDDDIWYYISLKKRGASLLKPKITDQKVVQLKFKNNILIEIKKYKGDKAKSFKFNKKKTKVEGTEHTILKDFTRNLGRYNKAPQKRG